MAMRERVIAEIERIVTETGKVPGVRTFESATGIMRREWIGKVWARWGDAIKEAGFEPNALTERLDSTTVLKSFADCCMALKRLPASNDLRLFARQNPGFPSDTTIEKHFPRRTLLAEALRGWALLPENHAYSAIAELLPVPVSTPVELPGHQNFGHVYLIRSGEFYKIGRSSNFEKRVKSIGVSLPEKLVPEHLISTDDPPGIEAYWHRRFADRRMNGEWFKLSKADVLAFKKRKFQ